MTQYDAAQNGSELVFAPVRLFHINILSASIGLFALVILTAAAGLEVIDVGEVEFLQVKEQLFLRQIDLRDFHEDGTSNVEQIDRIQSLETTDIAYI